MIETNFDENFDKVELEVLLEKLADAMLPGYQVEFDPNEAERVGAFIEDALSEVDAAESALDLIIETNQELTYGRQY